jgi:hypothetical protein
MKIWPEEDRSFVRIRDERLPDCSWLLRLPEYGYGRNPLRGVRWEVVREGERLRFSWEPPESLRKEAGVAYQGEVSAAAGEVEFRVTRQNLSEQAWKSDQASLFCLISADAATFHDIDGVRTYALKDGIFQSVSQLVNSRFAAHRMCGFPVRTGPGGPQASAVERLMAKISRDGDWVFGLATDIAGHLSCNHQPQVSCIHSNPNWGEVPPGGQATARGKVYLLPAPIEDLLVRYKADFETT